MTTTSSEKRKIPFFSAPFWRSAFLKYISRRLGWYVLTLLGSFTLAFIIFHLMPGDPMEILLGNLSRMEGAKVGTEKIVAYYRQLFGLDRPLYIQYFFFLRNVILRGLDFGPSFMAYPKTARDLIFHQLPWTLGLFTGAMLISWMLGTAVGVFMGWLRRRKLTTLMTGITVLLQATPNYLLAILLIIYVGYILKWLPPFGPYDNGLQPAPTWEFIRSLLIHMVLPMLSLVLVLGAGWAISMRSLMISILGEDYLLYAKARGLLPFAILKDYAFRNAMLPQLAALAITLGTTLTGTYIIEVIFHVPGLGDLFIRALGFRDYNVLQGIVLFSIFAVLTASLIIDLILPLLDPRIREFNE
jgi:peptide/nickel transport system permease protein